MSLSITLNQSIITLLTQHIGPVVIAVSGWPDSMCITTLIRDFWFRQWRSLADLHIAHYHHGLRLQSDDERDLVMQYCHGMIAHVWCYDGGSSTERDLRVARHGFFQSVMEEAWSSVLITGHNLTDRIETSLMNMRRGCQVKGFLNMRLIEEKNRLNNSESSRGMKMGWKMTILRPLLIYSKKQIQDYCDEYKIPYMIDESNADVTISYRNHIRHEIVMKLSDQELEYRQWLYDRLEASQIKYNDPVRDEQVQGRYIWQIGGWSLEYLSWLFDWSGCYDDMTQGRLLEWQQWIARSFSGEKFVWWWSWWITKKRVYMVKIS